MPQYEDLLKDSSKPWPDDNNYFELTITDLNVDTSYPLQFRWKYKDGSFGEWSAVKVITTQVEGSPATPSTLTVTGGAGLFTVTWDGKTNTNATMTNIDRIDIYIDGFPFDSTKAADSLFSAGTKTISAPAGVYLVSAFAVSKTGKKSAVNTPQTVTVTSNVPAAASSVTPSTPTVSSVLGAIQLSWDGKTSTGDSQPYGFTAAKVYVGTTSGFTPSSSNQVDVLNFANGQNILNIGLGTVVNGVALDHGIDYYVKIATTNGTDTSTAVSATGNPVRIGQVQSGSIYKITADKIDTGTLSAGSKITAGAPGGKRVEISGTGDTPFAIYGTGGTKIFDYNSSSDKLTVVGDGTFSGNLEIGSGSDIFKADPLVGIWLGATSFNAAPFSVSKNGVIKANSGTVGGWTLAGSYLYSGNIQLHAGDSAINVGNTASSYIKISATDGIRHLGSDGLPTGKFSLSTSGNLIISGNITATDGTFNGIITAGAGSTIGGWTSAATTITSANGNVILDSTGLIKFKYSGTQTGQIASSVDAFGNGGIQINYGSSGTNAGFAAVNGASALFSGVVNGAIQGLTIGSSGIGTFSSSLFVGTSLYIKTFLYVQSASSDAIPQVFQGSPVGEKSGGIRNIYARTSLDTASNYAEGDIFVVYQ